MVSSGMVSSGRKGRHRLNPTDGSGYRR